MVVTRRSKKIEEEKLEIEKKKWEWRRKDCDSSDSDEGWVGKTNKMVHSKDSPEKRQSASSVHPSSSSVPPDPSDGWNKSQQAQAKTDGMNSHPFSGMDSVREYDQEAERSGGDRVGGKHFFTVSRSDNEAERFDEDRLGAKFASTVSGSDEEAEESDGGSVRCKGAKSASTVSRSDNEAEESDGDRIGAKFASTVSGSDEEAEESDGGSVRRNGAKSASTVSRSDNEAEESDGDGVSNKRVKGSKILSPKGCATSRPASPSDSDRMKNNGEEQAAIDRVNRDSSSPPHCPYNKSFLTEQNCFRFKLFSQKGVVDQRLVDLGSFASLGVEQILKENQLLSTVNCVEPYVLAVVMEFYANLPSKETDRFVHKIYVRGKMYEFSPELINAVLELPSRKVTRVKETWVIVDLNMIAATLTGGNIKEWTKKITPANLSPPIAALHGICCSNWIPTSNPCTLTVERAKLLYMLVKKIPFNFGKLAYDQICRLGHLEGSKHMPVFPSLIHKVLNYQRPIPLHKGESLSHLAKPICYHIRLTRGKHVSLLSPPMCRKRKHVSSSSPSDRKRKCRSLPSTSGCCVKVQAYLDKAMTLLVNDRHRLKGRNELKGYLGGAMALIRMVSERLDADEDTNDDDARTE